MSEQRGNQTPDTPAVFDARRLNFIYQEERSDGRQSTFFRLETPDREDG